MIDLSEINLSSIKDHEVDEGSGFGDYAKTAGEIFSAPARFLYGAALWPVGKLKGSAAMVASSLKGYDPQESVDMAREAEEGFHSFMQLPFTPETKIGKAVENLPTPVFNEVTRLAKDVASSYANVDPRLGYLAEIGTELWLFKKGHQAATGAKFTKLGHKIMGKIEKIRADAAANKGKVNNADIDQVLKELDDEVYRLEQTGVEKNVPRTNAEGQAHFNRVRELSRELNKTTDTPVQGPLVKNTFEPQLPEIATPKEAVKNMLKLEDEAVLAKQKARETVGLMSEEQRQARVVEKNLEARQKYDELVNLSKGIKPQSLAESLGIKLKKPGKALESKEAVKVKETVEAKEIEDVGVISELDSPVEVVKEVSELAPGLAEKTKVIELFKPSEEISLKKGSTIKTDTPVIDGMNLSGVSKELFDLMDQIGPSSTLQEWNSTFPKFKKFIEKMHGKEGLLKIEKYKNQIINDAKTRGETTSPQTTAAAFTEAWQHYINKLDSTKSLNLVEKTKVKEVSEVSEAVEAIETTKPKRKPVRKIVTKPKELAPNKIFKNSKDAEVVYDSVSRSGFASQLKAEEFLIKFKEIPESQALLDRGYTPDIVKTGNKYRIAWKDSFKTIDAKGVDVGQDIEFSEGTKRIANESNSFLDPDKVVDKLRVYQKDILDWFEGDKTIDIKTIEDKVAELNNSLDPTNPSVSEVSGNVTGLLAAIRKRRGELGGPGVTEDFVLSKHPSRAKADAGVGAMFDKTGEPFKDMFQAMSVLKKNDLKGIVELHPSGEGWIISSEGPSLAHSIALHASKLKDLIEVLKKGLPDLNQRGSVEIDIKAMSPKTKEAIRKLILDAAKSRMFIEDYVKSLGYDAVVAEKIKKAAIGFEQTHSMGEPISDAYQTGKVVSRNKKEGLVSNWYEGQLERLRDIKDIKSGFLDFLDPARVTFDKMGEFFKETFETPYHDAVRAYSKANDLVVGEIRDWKSELRAEAKKMKRSERPKDSAARIYKYAISKREGGLARLQQMGLDMKDVPTLTPTEMKIYENMRKNLDYMGERINESRISVGKKPLDWVDDYFTFAYMQDIFGRIKTVDPSKIHPDIADKGIKLNSIHDPNKALFTQYTQFSKVPLQYLKLASKFGVRGAKLNLNAFDVFEKFMIESNKHVELTPIVARAHSLGKGLYDYKNLRANGKPKIWKLPTNIGNWLQDWSNFIAGKDINNILGKVNGTGRNVRLVEKAMSKLNKNIAISILGGNIRSAGIQISAMRNTIPEIGWKKTGMGIADMTTEMFGKMSPETKQIYMEMEKWGMIDLRKSDVAIADIYNSMVGSKLRGVYEPMAKYSMGLLQYLDIKTASATWAGAWRLGKDLGLEGKLRADFANDVVVKTQASALPGDLSPIQRTALGKFITLFQTFIINDFAFLTRDVLGIGNAKLSNKKAVVKAMKYVLATTLFNSFFEDVAGVQSPFPTPLRALYRSIDNGDDALKTAQQTALEMIDPIPIISGAKFGGGFFGAGANALEDIFNSAAGFERSKPLYETAPKVFGVPLINQTAKSIRAAKRGESPVGIILGRYTFKKKGKELKGLSGLKGLKGL